MLEYNPDAGLFTWRVRRKPCIIPGQIAGTLNKGHGYVIVCIDGRLYKAHRLAWFYMTETWPKADIDHINMIRADNRWSNLREATRAQNKTNEAKRTNNTSGYKGVTWNKRAQRWIAQLQCDGKKMHLGRFATAEDAYIAYVIAAKKAFGEFFRGG